MSPRTGRPPKSGDTRTEKLNIRISEKDAERIQWCADELGSSRTDAILQGITLLEAELKK